MDVQFRWPEEQANERSGVVCTPTPCLKVALGEPPTANHALTAVTSPLDAALATFFVRSTFMIEGRSTWATLLGFGLLGCKQK